MSDSHAHRRLSALVAAAYADGRLADSEKRILYRKAAELKVPLEVLSELMARGEKGQLSIQVPPSQDGREALLDELIELVCSDGRVESAEHELLARVARQSGVAGPDLRERIRREMERRPRTAERSTSAIAPPPRVPSPAASPAGPSPSRTPAAPPPLPPGPVRLEDAKPVPASVADIPPVTLQLIKQAISFENEEGAIQSAGRILSVPRAEAQRVVTAILAAFPELRLASHNRPGRRS